MHKNLECAISSARELADNLNQSVYLVQGIDSIFIKRSKPKDRHIMCRIAPSIKAQSNISIGLDYDKREKRKAWL